MSAQLIPMCVLCSKIIMRGGAILQPHLLNNRCKSGRLFIKSFISAITEGSCISVSMASNRRLMSLGLHNGAHTHSCNLRLPEMIT